MASNELQINIGADLSGVKNQLTSAENLLKKFQASLKRATDVNDITKLNRQIAITESSIGKLNSRLKSGSGLGEFPTKSKAATQSLIDLSRVAQDAPFGFIGIANNLNPLFEGFARLKNEAGGVKGALNALVTSLSGAGGIGLAVGIASGLLSAFGDELFKSEKKAEDLATEVSLVTTQFDRFQQKLEETTAAAATEGAKVAILLNAYGDSNSSLSQRKDILNQLAEISPKYLDSLSAEATSYQDLKKQVDLYIDSLAKEAEIKALLPQFEGIIQKIIKAQVELNQLNRTGGLSGIFGDDPEFIKNETNRLTSIIRGGLKEIEVAKKALSGIAGGSDNLFEIIFGKKDKVEKSANEIKEVVEKVKENLFSQVRGIDRPETGFFSDLFSGIRADKDRIIPFSVEVNGQIDAVRKIEEIREQARALGDTVVGFVQPAFTEFFNTLLSGGQNAFKAFANAIKQIIVKLAAAAVSAAIFAAIVSAVTGGAGGGFSALFSGAFKSVSGLGVNIGGGGRGGSQTGGIANRIGSSLGIANRTGGIVLQPSIAFSTDNFRVSLEQNQLRRSRS